MNALLDAALTYARRGWPVFPCHTPRADGTCSCRRDCGRDIGKHPRTFHGLKDASTDPVTIRRWWKMWPGANVAIVTGAVSGLAVLDVDQAKGGYESLDALEEAHTPLPETVQSLTGGGGMHGVFAHPGVHVSNSVATLGPGLAIRGDGGYIIAPPSVHASGTLYAWEVQHDPDDTPLAPMPAWLLALCQEPGSRPGPHRPSQGVRPGEGIPEGTRNATLYHLGCAM